MVLGVEFCAAVLNDGLDTGEGGHNCLDSLRRREDGDGACEVLPGDEEVLTRHTHGFEQPTQLVDVLGLGKLGGGDIDERKVGEVTLDAGAQLPQRWATRGRLGGGHGREVGGLVTGRSGQGRRI